MRTCRRISGAPDGGSTPLAGRRKLQVPEFLQPYLVELARGRDPQAALFGEHWRDWPRKWVQRICKAAGVPKVLWHGDGAGAARDAGGGQWDHLSRGRIGARSRVVQDDGREYAEREAVAGAQQKRRSRCSPEAAGVVRRRPPQHRGALPIVPNVPRTNFQRELKKLRSAFRGAERDRSVGLLNAISG